MSDSEGDLLDLGGINDKSQGAKYAEQNKQYKERAAKLGTDKDEKVSYDEMDYGDEMNDEEERRYARENFGSEEEDGEEDGEEEMDVVPLAKEFSRR